MCRSPHFGSLMTEHHSMTAQDCCASTITGPWLQKVNQLRKYDVDVTLTGVEDSPERTCQG
jgi:hypothetical protein